MLLPVEEAPWSSRGPIAHALAAGIEAFLDVARALVLLLLFSPLLLTARWASAADNSWQRRWWMRKLRCAPASRFLDPPARGVVGITDVH